MIAVRLKADTEFGLQLVWMNKKPRFGAVFCRFKVF